MPITTEDVRKTVDQGRARLDEARKPLYAVVGAGDLAVHQLRELPAETQAALDERMRHVRSLMEELRADLKVRITQLRDRAGQMPGRASDTAGRAFVPPAELRSRVEAYLGRAKEVYDDLAVRGAKVVTKVSDQPAVKTVIDRAESLLDRGQGAVSEAAQSVSDSAEAVSEATEPKTTTRRAPRKTTAAK
jgi:heparin binding hemagglutinin HbhA